ncbi:hypothetical protein BG003_011597 [Podila horticola]|nr:hypothetical protein BG003_011597 [Podila horticola]
MTLARGWIREVARNFEYALQGEPLGRLYNTRNPLPDGYQDPYVEGWDMEEEWEDDDERREDARENATEQEGEVEEEEGDEEEDEQEEDEATPPPALMRKYSPIRTHSGKERN